MKIEIIEKISEFSYYESCFVMANYSNIRKNPNKKVGLIRLLFRIFLVTCLYETFIILGWAFLYSIQNIHFDAYKIIPYLFALDYTIIMLCIFLFVILKAKYEKCSSQKQSVILDDIGIEQKVDDKQDVIIKWENIASIVINKHSICIIPKHLQSKLKSKLICLDIIHKEEFINAITQFNKQDLIVDNSKLYRS